MVDPQKQRTDDSLKSRVSHITFKIKDAIKLAKLQEIPDQKTIYFVLCPEYTFVQHHDDKTKLSYTQTDRDYIDKKFLKLSKAYPDVYFFPGTGMFQKSRFDIEDTSKLRKYGEFLLGLSIFRLDSRVEPYSAEIDKIYSTEAGFDQVKQTLEKFNTTMPAKNTTTIYHNGTIIGRYSKKNENIQMVFLGPRSSITSREPAALFYQGHSKSIFELEEGAIRLGVEICADHNSKTLVKALAKEGSSLPLDVHLVLSNTIDIEPYKVAYTPGHRSIVINCSGFFSSGGHAKYSTGIWVAEEENTLTKVTCTHSDDDVLIYSGIEMPQHTATKIMVDAMPCSSSRP